MIVLLHEMLSGDYYVWTYHIYECPWIRVKAIRETAEQRPIFFILSNNASRPNIKMTKLEWISPVNCAKQLNSVIVKGLIIKKINKSIGGTHMFSFQMYQKAFPLKRNLDDVPPACEQVQCSTVRAMTTTPWQWALSMSVTYTHHGKKLEQIILRNIATPLEVRPTIREVLLLSWRRWRREWQGGERVPHESVRKADQNKTKWRVRFREVVSPRQSAAPLHKDPACAPCWGNKAPPRSASGSWWRAHMHRHKHTQHENKSARQLHAATIWSIFCLGFLKVVLKTGGKKNSNNY